MSEKKPDTPVVHLPWSHWQDITARLEAQAAEIARLTEERDDLRCSVVAFGVPWAVEYARERGLPPWHLHATHYDILARAGARMDNFVRAPFSAAEVQ